MSRVLAGVAAGAGAAVSDDWQKLLNEITPYRWDATCPKCRNHEFVTCSDADDKPEPEVCDRCHNGIMRWTQAAALRAARAP